MSLFDEQDFAEISHPNYPGERLVCCCNPALKSARAHKRQELLEATEENLAKIAKSVKSGRLKGPDLRKTFAPLTFTDQNIPASANPVTPAGRSGEASRKDSTQLTKDDFPVYRYRDLLDHLATLSRQTVNFNGQQIEKITIPTPVQARAFELLGGPVPVALT